MALSYTLHYFSIAGKAEVSFARTHLQTTVHTVLDESVASVP
jgi:hypothetical protein